LKRYNQHTAAAAAHLSDNSVKILTVFNNRYYYW